MLYGAEITKLPIINFLLGHRAFPNPKWILLIAFRMGIELFPVLTLMSVYLEIVP